MTTQPDQREVWTATTRRSVLKAMASYGAAVSAAGLEGNLDCEDYITGIGFIGMRSHRAIVSALIYHEREGNVKKTRRGPEDEGMPPGQLYCLTSQGENLIKH